jgi:hypothetical protein
MKILSETGFVLFHYFICGLFNGALRVARRPQLDKHSAYLNSKPFMWAVSCLGLQSD